MRRRGKRAKRDMPAVRKQILRDVHGNLVAAHAAMKVLKKERYQEV